MNIACLSPPQKKLTFTTPIVSFNYKYSNLNKLIM